MRLNISSLVCHSCAGRNLWTPVLLFRIFEKRNRYDRRKWLKKWAEDQSGMVLVFNALTLPVILLLGVVVLQSGQLYVRQAQLQFLARQASNSSLVVMADVLQQAAEQNYQQTCNVERPPSVCSSNAWTDFLSVNESQNLASLPLNKNKVEQEAKNFATSTDPKSKLTLEDITVVFPYPNGDEPKLIAQVIIAQPQNTWIGNVLTPETYEITVESRSYLDLKSS